MNAPDIVRPGLIALPVRKQTDVNDDGRRELTSLGIRVAAISGQAALFARKS